MSGEGGDERSLDWSSDPRARKHLNVRKSNHADLDDITVDDCVEIFQMACIYGFADTRTNGARLAFGIAAAKVRRQSQH